MVKKDKEDLITKKIIEQPMGDDDIRYYLPDALIIQYKDLINYNSIDDLLKNNNDYCFLLYENSNCEGHWVAIIKKLKKNSKNKYDILYFDSYGSTIDNPLNWISQEKNIELGQDTKLLTKLFDKCNHDIKYNVIKYQKENKNDNINTCGRHCSFFIKNCIDCNRNLNDYYKFLKSIKNESGNSYDEIVSHLIRKT